MFCYFVLSKFDFKASLIMILIKLINMYLIIITNSIIALDRVYLDHPEENLPADEDSHYNAKYDRCEGIEFDAIAPDVNGNALFFKG